MSKFDYVTNENIKKPNLNWTVILDQLYEILIVGGSGSGKTNALLNVINNKPDIDKIYLRAKAPFEAKYQLSINKRESRGLKDLVDSKSFIECSNDIDNIYENL